MQPEFSPALTRLDAVMWFLNVQMWLSVVQGILVFLSSLAYIWTPLGSPFLLRQIGLAAVPVLLLLLFPSVLASNALGQTAHERISSPSDLRPLIGRCLGLLLFVQSLAQVVLYSGVIAYSLITGTGATFLGASGYVGYFLPQAVGPILSFFLGFGLAFGPAIRDNFRSR